VAADDGRTGLGAIPLRSLAYVRPWGWTWIDDAPWGFAPFHYGRWVWWRDRWGWAPGQYVARPVYAPALVAWIGGPNFSIGINLGGPAVGWVPLSPREHYLPTYAVTNVYITNVNSPHRRWQPPVRPNQPVRTGPIMYTNQGVPGGVTVVPQQVLRERKPISNAVIAPVDAGTIQRWQSQPTLSANGESRRQNAPPPPPAPAPRVVAAPGGAVPAVPGAVRATPWGQVAPAPRANVPTTPAARGTAAMHRARADRRPISTAMRRRRTARITTPPTPTVPATPRRLALHRSSPSRRLRRPCGPGNRLHLHGQHVQPTGAAGAARPTGARRSPGTGPGTRAGPVMRPAPGGEAPPANARGQGPTKDADDRDDRQPPGRNAASATAISERLGAGGVRRPPTPILRASSTRRIAMHGLPTYDRRGCRRAPPHGHAHRTPVLTSRTADEATGATLYFKCENFQRMGAFKFRGAFNALSCFGRPPTPARRGGFLVGQPRAGRGVVGAPARHAATIVMPHDAPAAKVAATRGYGGNVVFYDRYREDREAIGARLAEQHGMTLVPPYDHAGVIAGQQARGQGIARRGRPAGRAVRLPGRRRPAQRQRAGCARAVAAHDAVWRRARGRQRRPAIVAKWRDRAHRYPQTIADGAQTQHLGQLTFEIIRRDVDDIFTASDAELIEAMRSSPSA